MKKLYRHNFKVMITDWMSPMMVGVCDSVYGQQEDDLRIPVHQVQEIA